MVVVDDEELTANPSHDLNRILFELPACMLRVIGDSVLHIDNLFHSHRALQGPELSKIACTNRLVLGRETNRWFICNGCFDC